LQYSWNEGIDWWQFQFSETAVEITNIITEPSNTATRFILYGTTTIESNEQMVEQGVIITIDFEHLHTRQCEGIDNAGDVASDYEEWTPNGKINPECLMGKKVPPSSNLRSPTSDVNETHSAGTARIWNESSLLRSAAALRRTGNAIWGSTVRTELVRASAMVSKK
jgi:hypothetical protein